MLLGCVGSMLLPGQNFFKEPPITDSIPTPVDAGTSPSSHDLFRDRHVTKVGTNKSVLGINWAKELYSPWSC